MAVALSSLMIGDWMSLLSNLGVTGPYSTLGGTAEAVVLQVDAVVLEEVGSTELEGKLEPDV